MLRYSKDVFQFLKSGILILATLTFVVGCSDSAPPKKSEGENNEPDPIVQPEQPVGVDPGDVEPPDPVVPVGPENPNPVGGEPEEGEETPAEVEPEQPPIENETDPECLVEPEVDSVIWEGFESSQTLELFSMRGGFNV